MPAGIELTIRTGHFGEKAKTFALKLSDETMRELTETVELSTDPFSELLASPGMFGGYGSARTVRAKAFEMRASTARKIADALTQALIEEFGSNDELDGYKVSGMSAEELEFHKRTGRLAAPQLGGKKG